MSYRGELVVLFKIMSKINSNVRIYHLRQREVKKVREPGSKFILLKSWEKNLKLIDSHLCCVSATVPFENNSLNMDMVKFSKRYSMGSPKFKLDLSNIKIKPEDVTLIMENDGTIVEGRVLREFYYYQYWNYTPPQYNKDVILHYIQTLERIRPTKIINLVIHGECEVMERDTLELQNDFSGLIIKVDRGFNFTLNPKIFTYENVEITGEIVFSNESLSIHLILNSEVRNVNIPCDTSSLSVPSHLELDLTIQISHRNRINIQNIVPEIGLFIREMDYNSKYTLQTKTKENVETIELPFKDVFEIFRRGQIETDEESEFTTDVDLSDEDLEQIPDNIEEFSMEIDMNPLISYVLHEDDDFDFLNEK